MFLAQCRGLRKYLGSWPFLKSASQAPPYAGIGALADHRVLPVRAEVADVLAGRGIHHQHAPVAVAVGDVQDVGLRIDIHVRRPDTAGACR